MRERERENSQEPAQEKKSSPRKSDDAILCVLSLFRRAASGASWRKFAWPASLIAAYDRQWSAIVARSRRLITIRYERVAGSTEPHLMCAYSGAMCVCTCYAPHFEWWLAATDRSVSSVARFWLWAHSCQSCWAEVVWLFCILPATLCVPVCSQLRSIVV